MKNIKRYEDYSFLKTPVVCLHSYAKTNNLFVKLEGENLNGSIKSRTAYFLLRDILSKGQPENVVESSSGNLGLSLGYFANLIGLNFLCLVDETVPKHKLEQLNGFHVKYKQVALSGFPDYRTARITYAKELDAKPDWVWTNQYDNQSNAEAHYQTTGPELYEQLGENIDYFVCSAGSGGTISGVSRYLKEKYPSVKIVAVEPEGSTIFGGKPGRYLTAGSGLSAPSEILRAHWHLFDYFCKVRDNHAIQACIDVQKKEDVSIGITAGAALYVARYLSQREPDKRIACIAPDSGKMYDMEFKHFISVYPEEPVIRQVKKKAFSS